MKSRLVTAIAAVSLITVPLQPVMAKPEVNEVELHIEATAEVPPDHALVPIYITATGKDQAAADAELASKEMDFRASVAKLGIDPAKVKEQKDDDKTASTVGNDMSVCMDAASAAAEDAAAPAPRKRKGKTAGKAPPPVIVAVPPGCEDKAASASKAFTVELDDLTKLDAVMALGGQEYRYGRNMVTFTQADPAAAHKKARDGALAKAKADADGYADSMGYRIVRIERVSNARPIVSTYDIFDLIGMFAKMDRPSQFQPTWFSGTVYESVAVDYVMVPK